MKTGAGIREHGATVIVAALSTLFAATLILFTGIMTAALDPDLLEASGTFRAVLLMVSGVFIVIALYVGAIVTANTFATIIAGRTRTIALLRLVGATSRRVRSRVAAEGLAMGAIGAAIGWLLALALAFAAVTWGPQLGWLPEGRDYPLFDPLTIGAIGVVVLTTWVAAWAGSRRVGSVSPIAATGAAVELRPDAARGRTARTVWAMILIILGAVLLALGLLLGLLTPLALLVAFFGGLLSFTGIALGAHVIMPPILRLTGKVLGQGPTARLAAANATRFPERSARATIGLVIGVTLVTMFAVALDTYGSMTLMAFDNDPALAAAFDESLAITTAVFTGLVGFSAIIAAVGMVNTLSLSVLQRTRELGLLRALGFTGGQVRRMVIAESAQMTLAALGFGLVLGIFYGWAAAQSLLGSQAGLAWPTIPWPVIAGIVVFGLALAVTAAVAPARRAIRVSPVVALAID
ncbi:ABC transporter permease [Leucobacter luti]|uniref:Putative ABC transport system permease protein n=1 Tax=Leucobacter luti TaxID=340320 RepID=A0A4Q7TY97_9MICO|nr:ABC transporter permease [Leucobacter luti]MBL3698799.1 ABC transporter permease [Leucobacter luti]RZT66176.1 putative ABC transport system permease protein [Leucobacter luti]